MESATSTNPYIHKTGTKASKIAEMYATGNWTPVEIAAETETSVNHVQYVLRQRRFMGATAMSDRLENIESLVYEIAVTVKALRGLLKMSDAALREKVEALEAACDEKIKAKRLEKQPRKQYETRYTKEDFRKWGKQGLKTQIQQRQAKKEAGRIEEIAKTLTGLGMLPEGFLKKESPSLDPDSADVSDSSSG